MWHPAVGRYGVASRIHIASSIGLEILEAGGNAFDAAIAISSVLSLVIPHTGGLGGDAFYLVKLSNGEVKAYNGSGKSPADFPVEEFLESKPKRGGLTVSVPGLVDTWINMYEEYCSMDLRRLLQPAISMAENGFYIPYQLADAVSRLRDELSRFSSWSKVYGGLVRGSFVRMRRFARVLRMIARRGWDGFYTGRVAESIVEQLNREGSPISEEDFMRHRGFEFDPLRIEYGGYTVYELPPNTQGLTTLEILLLMDKLDLDRKDRSSEWWRLYFEAAAHAYRDRDDYLGDPDYMRIHPYTLLSDPHIDSHVEAIRLEGGDTTFFVVGDRYGNLVGFIQSLFHPFGSGLVAEEIPFQNRLIGFRMEDGYPNSPAPNKRPLHTLSILLAEKARETLIVGCAGGDLRPQIHTQVFTNIVDRGLDIARAVYEPRAMMLEWGDKRRVVVEKGASAEGESIPYPSNYVGVVQALRYVDGLLEVYADPRGGGTASSKS